MIIIQDKLVSDDVFDVNFICNLSACKGACCVQGDMGAPLEREELMKLDEIYPTVKKYLTLEGQNVIETQGYFVKEKDGNLYTPLIEGEACAYIQFDEAGIAKCGIEMAYLNGETDFKKPISCHLYPIRITSLPEDSFEAINYDVWDICSAACKLGDQEKVPVYRFLKEPLIRKYGEDFFEELDHAFQYLQKDKS